MKHDVSNGKEYLIFEKISKNPNLLRKEAKKFYRRIFLKEKERQGTTFVKLKGFQECLESQGDPDHLFCHESASVYTKYGKIVWVLDLQILKIEELK